MNAAAQRVSSVESRITRHAEAFTLIELLTVIAIIGILASLLTPVLKNFGKPDVTVSATRQMLDACARGRALAMSQRSTVLMVFIPTNFWDKWGGVPEGQVANGTPWNQLMVNTQFKTSMVTTQAFGAQLNGYMLISLRNVGDQPGRGIPKDRTAIETLPQGSFIAPFKFTTTVYGGQAPYPINRPDLPIYGFQRTNNIPFPSANALTNTVYATTFSSGGLTLPYVAFNYLGQLATGDGSLLPYDENIPLDYGSMSPALSSSKLPIQAIPSFSEEPPGNSTNISYNIIHIDRLTGRARLERQDAL